MDAMSFLSDRLCLMPGLLTNESYIRCSAALCIINRLGIALGELFFQPIQFFIDCCRISCV